tara:strand:+ start:1925 stop:2851 length:927 start_codon:yes stop_codon:yes gene_type:complete
MIYLRRMSSETNNLDVNEVNEVNEEVVVVESNLDNIKENSPEFVSEFKIETKSETLTIVDDSSSNSKNKYKSRNSLAELNNLDTFDTVHLQVQDYVRNFHLTPNNVMLLITKVVEIVNKVKGLSFDEKKEYTERICLEIIEDNSNLNDTDKQYIRLMLNTFINFVFELSNKKVVLKVKKNKNLRNKPMIELVESILSKILKIVKNKNYDFDSLVANIPVLIGMIISFTSAIPDLTGFEKKNISILVITKLLDNNINGLFELNDSQINTVNFVKQTLPETIDIIIGIAKGKFDLKDQITRIILCCSKNL